MVSSPTFFHLLHVRQIHSLLLHNIQSPTTQLWDSLISRFASSSRPHLSLLAYITMLLNNALPTIHTFPHLFKAVSKLNSINLLQCHSHISKFGFDSDGFVMNSLVSAYSRCGYVADACIVFGDIRDKDVVSWTAMIDGFVNNRCGVEALECFLEMKKTGVSADGVTVVSVLVAAGMLGDVWFGRSVHGFYVEAGRVRCDVHIGSALVDMYAKCGCSDDARKVFEEMPTRNVVTWSAMIAGYVQRGCFKEGLSVFRDMLLEGVRPNEWTFTSVLTACAQLGALEQGRWVHAYSDRNSIEMKSNTGTALIDMYAKCGCLDEALLVFEKMPEKNVYTWTAMINGLAMHGDTMGALNLLSRMIRSRVLPNEVTFIGVLSACAHGGLVEEGRRLFRLMKEDYHLEPNVDHYGCMVDLLGRAGFLEEAMDLINKMPMEPTAGIWGALLAACMNHKDFELGEYVGSQLIELQPYHSGSYALLANLYHEGQNWDAAAGIRKLMKEKRVGKTPGCSWIELNGVLHEFVAFDKSHCESSGLYDMLDNVNMQMKLTRVLKN